MAATADLPTNLDPDYASSYGEQARVPTTDLALHSTLEPGPVGRSSAAFDDEPTAAIASFLRQNMDNAK
jgi:hypothetical protein